MNAYSVAEKVENMHAVCLGRERYLYVNMLMHGSCSYTFYKTSMPFCTNYPV